MRQLIERARRAGMKQQIMTTNGTLKADSVHAMHDAGLDRVNVSLDTLNPDRFQNITGRPGFEQVCSWIHQACQTFSLVTKMNIVPMRDNLDEVPEFIRFAQQYRGKLALKFIELCPNNPAFYGKDIHEYAVSRSEIIVALERVGTLIPSQGVGDNPNAEFYIVGDTGVQVILITMPSQDFKCGRSACRKMRISPFGLAGSCIKQKGKNLLGQPLEKKIEIIRDLMLLREGYSDELPCARRHFREDYGIWRFGQLKECGK
jgi:cyclic pyranopterin phosphate synthase